MFFYFILGLYAILIFSFILIYFFIIYHLAKYSLNASLNKVMLPLFILVSTLLLFSNILLFFSVNWSGLLPQFRM